ncbi:DUF6252 family protein [Marixanthomonas spongiae]|uniref:Lipoprotein n=1 Tax=Marixanthomonas spongiae TaxID=2174845 RepID=A0A2U0I7P9_9FLAO|nr:DUF6252 family protein [Marixanthomonas spongiae]PVW17121.1 hypothetical protein DDV96_00965 [Marixanthomonas spongiae]
MKTIKTISLILFVSLSLLACKSDDDGGDDPQGGEGNFTAKVDGNSYKGMSGTVVAEVSGNGAGQTLAVSGGTSKSENLQVIIIGFDGEGTYQLNFTNIGTYSYLPDPNNPDPNSVVVYTTVGDAQNNYGELKVSSYDGDSVKGTFSFTGYNLDDLNDTVAVTEGSFNIKVNKKN